MQIANNGYILRSISKARLHTCTITSNDCVIVRKIILSAYFTSISSCLLFNIFNKNTCNTQIRMVAIVKYKEITLVEVSVVKSTLKNMIVIPLTIHSTTNNTFVDIM